MQNKPYIDPLTRSILLNVLWHHQGGSSQVGQPIRAMLGIGEYERMTDWQVRVAQEIESMVRPQPGVEPPDWQRHVTDAWATLRKFNHSIPDNVLDTMRDKLMAANFAQHTNRDEMTRMVDAAMVAMANISPPLRRNECQTLIFAALETNHQAPAGSGGWQEHAENMEKERDHWKTLAETMRAHQGKDVWYWQGDGSDNPASMVNSLTVVLRADQLRGLLMAKAEVQPNPWQQAVDAELVSAHLGIAGNVSFADAAKALSELIQWNIDVATNPQTNGGLSLQPVSEVQAEPVLYVSPEQQHAHTDPKHPYGGRYLPARKTPKGNFTQPLFTSPQATQQDAIDSGRWRKTQAQEK